MSEAMDDEFDTVAQWTADAARALGPQYAIPAACRGSGGPAALDWLLDKLRIRAQDRMLDAGAGVGGPAAYAAHRTGVRPVLAEPEPGACRAARALFDLPVVTAPGHDLPFNDQAFDVAWSLAVLCTVEDKTAVLTELRRVLAEHGRLGLLVYVRTSDDLTGGPRGNVFPTEKQLDELIADAGFAEAARTKLDDLAPDPPDWTQRCADVDELLKRRHGTDDAWRTAQQQSEAFGSLLRDGRVHGVLLALNGA